MSGRNPTIVELRHATRDDGSAVAGYVDSSETWVAEVDGEVAGFVAIGTTSVDHLHVESKWAGKGIDRRLLALAKYRRPTGDHTLHASFDSGA